MTDNGARALAVRLHEAEYGPLYPLPHGVSVDCVCDKLVAAILANGAAFLPDAAELDRLRRIEAAARRLDESGRLYRPEYAALRAALQPERSARDGG